MTVSQIMQKMIVFYNGDHHDVNHVLKVWSYAKTIGELEGLDSETQKTLEIAAILHDVAIPLCREKYGNADGKHQEEEGGPLTREFLRNAELAPETVERVAYLVSHHHTLTDVDGRDYQILLEADYLVNADEGSFSRENIVHMLNAMFKTRSGIALLKSVYGV